MTQDEIAVAVALVVGNYPHLMGDRQRLMCTTWLEVLGDLPDGSVLAATKDVLQRRGEGPPPTSSEIRMAAVSRISHVASLARGLGDGARPDRAKAQAIRALVANVAASFSLDEPTNRAGRTGAVYERIRKGAEQRGVHLPAWGAR